MEEESGDEEGGKQRRNKMRHKDNNKFGGSKDKFMKGKKPFKSDKKADRGKGPGIKKHIKKFRHKKL